MKLIEDAKTVFLRAWSVRLSLLAALLSAAEVSLPFFAPWMPEHVMAILAVLVGAGAAIARIVAQPTMHQPKEPTP